MTYGSYRRLRAQNFDASKVETWESLATDPDVLATVLNEICGEQMRERGLSQDDFEAAFDLEVAEAAIGEVIEAIIDFFPKQRQKTLRTLWEKVNARAERLLEKTTNEASTLLASNEINEQIDTLLTNQLSG
jgi:hypothetical protein